MTENKWKIGVFIAVVAIIAFLYWRNFQQSNASASQQPSGGDVLDIQFQQARRSHKQPSGQDVSPAGNGPVVYGSPVGFDTGTTQTNAAAMSLPVNL